MESAEVTKGLFIFSGAVPRDPAVESWMQSRPEELASVARHWFGIMRDCGDDVRELLHDGHPTACAGDAAFAYVNAFTSHVNVGFFRGSELPDPKGLLIGTGKMMRHVRIGADDVADGDALERLIQEAYHDMKRRLHSE